MCEYKPRSRKRFMEIVRKFSGCVLETRQPLYELAADTVRYLIGKIKKGGRKSGEEIEI